ncbi:hypothetical protein [uncultured Tateyamaria sp.]|uniref:hypothetical protein n=1 Tax=uncultured Tateyamaria sp. TaxID=455651 RepID=UPI00260B7C79|nr:hypothetical protein [uncultured Tateyamaria sp.]
MTSANVVDSVAELVDIVASAGGELIGRTRLQKTAFLLLATGLGAEQFKFRYKHYGPYSESLASTSDMSKILGSLTEEQRPSTWGGTFSVFRTETAPQFEGSSPRVKLIKIAKAANPIDLELAATSAFLAFEGHSDPWKETAARKPDKASRIDSAKNLYAELMSVNTPKKLPSIV